MVTSLDVATFFIVLFLIPGFTEAVGRNVLALDTSHGTGSMTQEGLGRRSDPVNVPPLAPNNTACLSSEDAYVGSGCCAGTCGTTYSSCFDCTTNKEQDPLNYGGPLCFRAGSCLQEESEKVCSPPSRGIFNDVENNGKYTGWCICPMGTFCSGDQCDATSPRDRWNPMIVRKVE